LTTRSRTIVRDKPTTRLLLKNRKKKSLPCRVARDEGDYFLSEKRAVGSICSPSSLRFHATPKGAAMFFHNRLARRESACRRMPTRLSVEALEDRMLLSLTFAVTNTNDSGPGSLRAAIVESNALNPINVPNLSPGPNYIVFDIGSGAKTIAPLSPLPTFTYPTVVDGETQPGYSGKPLIQLSGQNMVGQGAVAGLDISTSANAFCSTGSTVEGLVINGFSSGGILLDGGGDNVIQGNYLGTDTTGTKAVGGGSVSLFGSSNNTIGGTSPAVRNVVSGNFGSDAITIEFQSNNNLIAGNYLGTDVTGTHALNNGIVGTNGLSQNDGVFIGGGSSNNQVGGILGAGNLISGNFNGVVIANAGSSNNLVVDNRIGTDVKGTISSKNFNAGVMVLDAANNSVGGAEIFYHNQFYFQGNVISGNGYNGVVVQGSTNTTVAGNKIGTDITGTKPLGNGSDGVVISSASYNLIGGTGLGAGNVIAANGANGVEIDGSSMGNSIQNQVQGNWIGTDHSGKLHLGNHQNGVFLCSYSSATAASYGNQIGGADIIGPVDPGVGNTIAFNTHDGVSTQGPLMVSNPVRGDSIYGNGGAAIDTDDWPACSVRLLAANSAAQVVQGYVVNENPNNSGYLVVDLYASSPSDGPPGQLQGRRYLGTEVVYAPLGFAIPFAFTGKFAKGEVISATITDYSFSTTSGIETSVVAV
jgi:hypothetical protein